MIVSGAVGQACGLAAGDRHHKDFAVHDERHVPLVKREGELRGALSEGDGLLRVDLIVGVDFDGQLARLASLAGHDPKIGPALVDDPLPAIGIGLGADAGTADPVFLVEGDLLRRALAGRVPTKNVGRRLRPGACASGSDGR